LSTIKLRLVAKDVSVRDGNGNRLFVVFTMNGIRKPNLGETVIL